MNAQHPSTPTRFTPHGQSMQRRASHARRLTRKHNLQALNRKPVQTSSGKGMNTSQTIAPIAGPSQDIRIMMEYASEIYASEEIRFGDVCFWRYTHHNEIRFCSHCP